MDAQSVAATLAGSMLDRASRAIRHCLASKRGEGRRSHVHILVRHRATICLPYALFSISTTAARAATHRRHASGRRD